MLQASDGVTQLNLYTWIPKGLLKKAPTYVVCINHGMAEHALRYDNFAQFLCEKNIAVYAHDQRGHGKTATTESELGFLADANGFQHATEDLRCVLQTARNDFPKAKIILLGHSFGSFVSQSFIEQFGDETDACILSGTAGPRLALTIPGSVIAAIIKKIKGSRYRSKFLDKLTFGSYLNKIPKPCADFAWLSSDAQAVKAYEEDPLCGFLCTAGFFYDITSGLTRIHLQKN
ncbi:MAG: alpha/beta fold hydrolase, partial [Spirochaetales bacterium]